MSDDSAYADGHQDGRVAAAQLYSAQLTLADALAAAVEAWDGSLGAVRSLSADPELTRAIFATAAAYLKARQP